MWFARVMTWIIIVSGTINLLRMAIFMIGSDLYAVFAAKKRKRIGWFPLPSLSVVIPAHNEATTIERSLMSVIEAQYEREKLQILVADDGSSDETASVVKGVIAEHPEYDITLISRPNAGKARALNYAMQTHARGELVMCLDADSSVERKALVNAARHFTDPRVVALSANVKIHPSGTLLNLIQRFEYLVSYQMKRAQTLFNIEYIIGGIGSTFRRSALESVGYYDTNTVTEDIDLTMKFLQRGNRNTKVAYGADVIAYTESALSVGDLIKQRSRWKWGRGQTFEKNWSLFFARGRKHGKLLSWLYLPYALISDALFFLEPFVISYLLYILIRYADFITIASAAAIIGAYIGLNIIAEDTVPWREKIVMLLWAPIMYFLFYVLSFAEYVALIRTYANYGRLKTSLAEDNCGWQHVARARV